jgi:hypothetical protein
VRKQGNLTEGEGSVQLTSLYERVKISYFRHYNHYLLFIKQATLKRRSTVLSLPLHLVFPCAQASLPVSFKQTEVGGGRASHRLPLMHHFAVSVIITLSYVQNDRMIALVMFHQQPFQHALKKCKQFLEYQNYLLRRDFWWSKF